jgi:uncharacterized membrane protein YkgB
MTMLSTQELQRVQVRGNLAFQARFDQAEQDITAWLARHSLTLLRLAIGTVYIWFGALKFVHGLSPIEDFIRASLPFLSGDLFLPFLAAWEVLIGVGFIVWKYPRLTILLMLGQMVGAMSPLVLATDMVFNRFPYGWNLVGQYIFKDIILISAALVLASTVRGGGLHSEKPQKRGK